MEAVIDKDKEVPVKVHPIDEKPPLSRLIPLGLQHVLVMYAGAVAVPLIIGGALKLPKDQIAMLINADLICCGIATLIQSLGLGKSIGIRILSRVDYNNRHNLIIVAVSIGVGMIPLVADKFFQYFPKALGPVLHSGILLTAIAALLLNLFFNGFQSAAEADREAAASSHGTE